MSTLTFFKTPEIVDLFSEKHRIILNCGDTYDFLQTIPNETVI